MRASRKFHMSEKVKKEKKRKEKRNLSDFFCLKSINVFSFVVVNETGVFYFYYIPFGGFARLHK